MQTINKQSNKIMEKEKLTYFDSISLDIQSYKELYAKSNGISSDCVDNSDLAKFIKGRLNETLKSLYAAIDSNKNNLPCVVCGEITYHGTPYMVFPTPFETICDAIKKCVDGYERYEVAQFNGHLEITSACEDGVSFFSVYLLNKKGIVARDRIKNDNGKADLSKDSYHRRIDGAIT